MELNELQLAAGLDAARSFIEAEKPLHAVQVYHRLIHQEPGFVPAYAGLASLYAEIGTFPAAVALLQRALAAVPGEIDLIVLLGSTYLRMGNADAALACFRQLEGKKLPRVHFTMGVAYCSKHDAARAEEQFRLVADYDPSFPKINSSLGELLVNRAAYREAITFLKRGIASDPYSPLNHRLLGIAYGRLGVWKSAYREFILAVDMDPSEPVHWQLCGEALHRLGRHREAEPYVRKAIRLEPGLSDAPELLARILAMQRPEGSPEGAGSAGGRHPQPGGPAGARAGRDRSRGKQPGKPNRHVR